jgi:uncharacterized protein (TIGR02231 family)
MYALALLALFAPLTQDPQVLETRIDSVTVYPQSAHIHRTSEVIAGDGRYVITGLTNDLDRQNVRVKCTGGQVARVEIKERLEKKVTDAELALLVEELKLAKRELQAVKDTERVNEAMRKHLAVLFEREQQTSANALSEGQAPTEAWSASFEFLSARLTSVLAEGRELGWEITDREEAIKKLGHEIGDASAGALVAVVDVIVETVGCTANSAKVEVEYVVRSASWSPVYDLRTAKDAESVELVYRAEVLQRTRENWNDVELMLSTAQPQLGAQGPDPYSQWVTVKKELKGQRFGGRGGGAPGAMVGESAVMEDAVTGSADFRAREMLFAAVESEGLSLRYRIARSETVESKDEPSLVLVGKATLEVDPEYYCAPALDTTVWLRGIATNTSAWTLLPGRAAVFFGADFLGEAWLESVQLEEEFTLHLGAAPMVSVERTQFEDIAEEPGFLSNTMSRRRSWRVHFENHGSTVTNGDGSITVIVRESVPITKDSRLEVLIPRSEPSFAKGDRWDQERDEEGIYTWLLDVPADGEGDLVYSVELRSPKELEVIGW